MPEEPLYHIAQINIGRIRHETDDTRMADFMDNLDRINELAERSPGFVWRLKDDTNNATNIRLYDDPHLLLNMSVWRHDRGSRSLHLQDRAHAFRRTARGMVPAFRNGVPGPVVGRERAPADGGRGPGESRLSGEQTAPHNWPSRSRNASPCPVSGEAHTSSWHTHPCLSVIPAGSGNPERRLLHGRSAFPRYNVA